MPDVENYKRGLEAKPAELAAGGLGSCLQYDELISERRLRALFGAALSLRRREATDNSQGSGARRPELAIVYCRLTPNSL